MTIDVIKIIDVGDVVQIRLRRKYLRPFQLVEDPPLYNIKTDPRIDRCKRFFLRDLGNIKQIRNFRLLIPHSDALKIIWRYTVGIS
jgi:hypothetical protein